MIIPKETPWAVLLCKFSPDLSAGHPMGYSAKGTRVVFRGQGNQVCELSLGTSSWGMANLTAAINAPAAAGNPMGYFAQVPRVVYRGQDNHIYEIANGPKTVWGLFDLSGSTNAPAAVGDPMGYFAQVPRVVYRGQDNHIYEIAIYPETGAWGLFDMTGGPAAAEPFPRWFYENLFTTSGIGFNNMIDFFRVFSHGNMDLTKSQVFGWLTLTQGRCDYTGSGLDQAGRQALIDWARTAASAAGVDLSPFFGVVVCMNVPTDLFGNLGGKAMVCDNNSMTPSLLGQEMGHGYGLDHSRADGSAADYQDKWDVMSTLNAFMASDPNFTKIGPSLNVANMDSHTTPHSKG